MGEDQYIKSALFEISDNIGKLEQHASGAVHVLIEIKEALTLTNRNTVDRSIGEHRIGALRRISAAIEYINGMRYLTDQDTRNKFDDIRNILLDIKGR